MSITARFSALVGLLGMLVASMGACLDVLSVPCGSGYCPRGYTCHEERTCLSTQGCGNAVKETELGEDCDDGNQMSGDGCSADCESDETCGNHYIDLAVGEMCDDGGNINGDGCSADCRSNETCGNHYVDKALGEICDDGDTTSGDGCSADCRSNETCGNGIIDEASGEHCDDGNHSSGDCPSSCRYDCKNHEGRYWVCHDALSWHAARDVCLLHGSDLVIIDDFNEDLRVGRLLDGHFWIGLNDEEQEGTFLWSDGSSLSYQAWAWGEPNNYADLEHCVEAGYGVEHQWNDLRCEEPRAFVCESSTCTDCSCGNGRIELGEECDDGNESPGDGCDAACRIERVPENEPNEDGTPQIWEDDFSIVNANGPYETDTFIVATLEPAGDEDVFAIRNSGPDVVRVRFDTHDMNVGEGVPCDFIDTVLVVRDSQGNELASNDDRADGNFCSTIEHDLEPGETVYTHVLEYEDGFEIPVPGYGLTINFQ